MDNGLARHVLEQELQGVTPRKLKVRTRGPWLMFWFVRLFLVPFILVGIGTLSEALQTSGIALVGNTTAGTVISRDYNNDSEGGGGWYITYSFKAGDHLYSATDKERSSHAVTPGELVKVKYASWLPSHASYLVVPDATALHVVGLIWFFTLFWNAITGVFFAAFYIAPVYDRMLYTNGSIAVGNITAKNVQTGESNSYTIEYTYQAMKSGLGSGEDRKGTNTIAKSEWDNCEVGDPVSILYLNRRYRNSVAYKFGMYTVLPKA